MASVVQEAIPTEKTDTVITAEIASSGVNITPTIESQITNDATPRSLPQTPKLPQYRRITSADLLEKLDDYQPVVLNQEILDFSEESEQEVDELDIKELAVEVNDSPIKSKETVSDLRKSGYLSLQTNDFDYDDDCNSEIFFPVKSTKLSPTPQPIVMEKNRKNSTKNSKKKSKRSTWDERKMEKLKEFQHKRQYQDLKHQLVLKEDQIAELELESSIQSKYLIESEHNLSKIRKDMESIPLTDTAKHSRTLAMLHRYEKECQLYKALLNEGDEARLELQKQLNNLQSQFAIESGYITANKIAVEESVEKIRVDAMKKKLKEDHMIERVKEQLIEAERKRLAEYRKRVEFFEKMQDEQTQYRSIAAGRANSVNRKISEEKSKLLAVAEENQKKRVDAENRVRKLVQKARETTQKKNEIRKEQDKRLLLQMEKEYDKFAPKISKEDYIEIRKAIAADQLIEKKKTQLEVDKKEEILKKILKEYQGMTKRDKRRHHVQRGRDKIEEVKHHVDQPKEKVLPTEQLGQAPLMYFAKSVSDKEENDLSRFSSKPEKIVIKDYEAHKIYNAHLTLTNISSKPATFRVLPIPIEVQDFFRINFNPPGLLSPGLTCVIGLEFLSPFEEDISTSISFQLTSSILTVPIECRTRKVIPRISATEVIFEKISIGQSSEHCIKLYNEGFIKTRFRVLEVSDTGALKIPTDKTSIEFLLDEYQAPEPESESSPFSILSDRLDELESYGSKSIKIRFSPSQVGQFEKSYGIDFEDKSIMPLMLKVMGYGDELDVFVECLEYDLGICSKTISGTVSFAIGNRGRIPRHFSLESPPNLSKSLDFSPSSGFVQPNQKMDVKIRFRPPSEFKPNGEEGNFNIILKLNIKSQASMELKIRGRYTSMDLAVFPRELNFGLCHVEENVGLTINIRNDSIISQKIHFHKPPSGFSFQERTNFLEIPAEGTVSINLIFSPTKEGHVRKRLSFKSEHDQHYTVPLLAKVVDVPVKFSSPIMHVAPCSPWDIRVASTILHNHGCEEFYYNFQIPQLSNLGVNVHPNSGRLEKHQKVLIHVFLWYQNNSCKIEIPKEFQPTNLTSAAVAPEQPETPKGRSRRTSAAIQLKEHGNDSSRHNSVSARKTSSARKLSSATLTKSVDLHQQSANTAIIEPLDISSIKEENITVYIPCVAKFVSSDKPDERQQGALILTLQTKIIKPVFFPRFSSTPDERFPTIINFGGVPSGTTSVECLHLENLTENILQLKPTLLDPFGAFEIVNILKPIGARSAFALKISFSPKSNCKYLDNFTLECPDQSMRFTLSGFGIQGSYKLQGIEDDQIVCPDCFNGEATEKPFSIVNTCAGTLKCTISISSIKKLSQFKEKESMRQSIVFNEDHEPNAPEEPVFKLSANSFSLGTNESKEIIVTFNSREEKMEYEASLELVVQGCESKILNCIGKCGGKKKAK